MDEFQIYTVKSQIFGDPTPNKRRPSVFVGLSSEDFGFVRFLGIYTYRDRFKKSEAAKRMYKIQDEDVAHVKSVKGSYIDVSSEIIIPFSKVNKLAEPEHIGELSERDIHGLIAKYNEYYNN